ncbi:fatty acid synthase subunit alpha reductase [Dothidotthia symphoricarpi CBS 119687]|uniref:beta-ketoacyl-[acyl-carrier-protein] synthase I n=1 Tax=Dothidotthia symphoricarpi CBS 119687 TaxID=1392245 RepID=A0A6A6A341_9PLEO|nr:fatty acid synthase subunit alpha reductase [Dothidotthia symphoricarpi CBS 119687]KAF2125966.1 fatty acid synthase subunit alpha reductase [Dothidotthia symphoricarpi CBS 119687]
MHPDVERELTHTLLIELLAHQFTFPVKWIDTQDVILGQFGTERIVEVGPSNVLTNMMKRTWSAGFKEQDESQGVQRRILGPQSDQDEIYYRELPEESVHEQPSPVDTQARPPTEPVKPDAQPVPIPTSTSSAKQPLESVEDVETPTSAIVLAIVAGKLKRDRQDVPLNASVSSLAAGRSTLTNEIIGDLLAEFKGKLPERSEDLPLEELCRLLSVNHTGRLGKQTESMVSRLISAKFPPEFAQSTIRQTLENQWGLGPMRQDAVLLSMVSDPPDARLSIEKAHQRLINWVTSYFQEQGISMSRAEPANDQAVMIDSKAMQMVTEKSSALVKDIRDVLESHVQDTSLASRESDSRSKAANEAIEKLDVWVSEHGEVYGEGILPKFDVNKERTYDSFWNWNTQDIVRLAQLLGIQHSESQSTLIEDLSFHVINRACNRSISQIKYLMSTANKGVKEGATLYKSLHFLHEACLISKNRNSVFIDRSVSMAPLTMVDDLGEIQFREIPRISINSKGMQALSIPYAVSQFSNGVATFSEELSSAFASDLQSVKRTGFSFQGKNVLLNGAGRRSIGFHILRSLLEGGARVTLTTSSYSPKTTQMYQDLYRRYGSRHSVLRVLPFNQGSQRDVKNLVQYLESDPAWDLDYVVPFAAISENGRSVEDIDSKSELAHRLMLTNLVRLLGAIAMSKKNRNIRTRPATVILPLSPNHGLMGGDGLYSESKRSLETLMAKWSSEAWAEYLSLFGVVIGWTRGTGLMDDNDVVAQAVEALGVRTFATDEMASNIVCLMGGRLNAECQSIPLFVDLGGGLNLVKDFKNRLAAIRRDLLAYAHTRKAIHDEMAIEASLSAGPDVGSKAAKLERTIDIKSNLRIPFPTLPDYEDELAPLSSALKDMIDLSRTVVVTGFAELGPHGSSRTRWEMEADGSLSLEGCIEMAWMMGLIRHQVATPTDDDSVAGWVDAATQRPVKDSEIPTRYLSRILEHSGVRTIEPEICDNGYDPEFKESLQELVLKRDLPPFETSAESAKDLRRKHGDKAMVSTDNTGTCHVQLKAGATLMVPRTSRFNRTVAGQIPTGWSPKRYGISDDIIHQVDPVTLFSLVCTVEAFLSSGILDPYELYQHIHVSEVGICIGSSMGGLSSLRSMHRDRFIDKQVKSDVLQETFINTTGAWVNMLLTSSSGPIRTPVGACATSLESLDTAYDLIVAQKAKVCIVGGVEDFVEDVSYEFGSMKATCDTDAEFAAGRSAPEMSRPMASSRSGFVESQGCGVQIVTSAELALKMGLPIYGVVAHTSMSADKASRSVPAPGKGVLTNARERHSTAKELPRPLLDLKLDPKYRRKQLDQRRNQIASWRKESIAFMEADINMFSHLTEEERLQYRRQNTIDIEKEALKQQADATFNINHQFWQKDEAQRISPIRGSLATWGLGIDDISVASLHGTSTVLNDLNETLVIEQQMRHLGRKEGNLLPCVSQKWLTGHSKGAAGAWMLNGCLQMMDSGLVTGNRNADNIDIKLRERGYLYFPNVTLELDKVDGIKACSITSFGFGQKGCQALMVHPRYLLSTISKAAFEQYAKKRQRRWQLACSSFSDAMVNENMVSRCIKDQAPYESSEEMAALLDPLIRFGGS